MSMDCTIGGNPDLYGVGIRVGLYLQWISTLLSTIFVPGDEDILRVANLLVQSAIFVALLHLSARGDLHAVDAVLATWLVFGALSSLSGSGINPLGCFSGTFRVLFYTAFASYACWFWFSGLDAILARDNGCGGVAFFGGTSITGPFRDFNKVAAIIGLTVCTAFIIANVWVAFKRYQRKTSPDASPPRPVVELSLLLISGIIIILSIASIEYLIKANNIVDIDDVNSIGQLLPLLVGVFGIADAVFDISQSPKVFAPRCLLLFGQHLT